MKTFVTILAVLFTLLFIPLAYTIWFAIQMEGAGTNFWSNGIVQFTVVCFALALIGWVLVIVMKNK